LIVEPSGPGRLHRGVRSICNPAGSDNWNKTRVAWQLFVEPHHRHPLKTPFEVPRAGSCLLTAPTCRPLCAIVGTRLPIHDSVDRPLQLGGVFCERLDAGAGSAASYVPGARGARVTPTDTRPSPPCRLQGNSGDREVDPEETARLNNRNSIRF